MKKVPEISNQYLKLLRVSRGLRQIDVARAAGIDQTTVSRIEKGLQVRAEQLNALVRVLTKPEGK